MLKMRDRYLHTNCLAALANMSGLLKHFHIIDPLPLCRTILYNMLKIRDLYLHTNCLAALGPTYLASSSIFTSLTNSFYAGLSSTIC